MLFTACCILTTTLTEKYHIAVVCISVTHHLMTSRSEAINATHTVHPLTEALDLLSHHFSYNHHKTPVDYNLSVNIAPCMATWCITSCQYFAGGRSNTSTSIGICENLMSTFSSNCIIYFNPTGTCATVEAIKICVLSLN